MQYVSIMYALMNLFILSQSCFFVFFSLFCGDGGRWGLFACDCHHRNKWHLILNSHKYPSLQSYSTSRSILNCSELIKVKSLCFSLLRVVHLYYIKFQICNIHDIHKFIQNCTYYSQLYIHRHFKT